ncbi:hypothetical protein GCM10027072_76700 [Streptomyces bullii]
MTYCSHVTVLVLCSACSGASANQAIKSDRQADVTQTPAFGRSPGGLPAECGAGG